MVWREPLLVGAYVDPRSGEQSSSSATSHDPERSEKRLLEDSAQNEAMSEFLAGTSRCDEVVGEVEAGGQGSSISVQFGGNQIDVQIAEGVCDELTAPHV